ncbi:MAG: NAD(P)-dependent oxidoreductase [Solirubrobacterales bacterium]|nr:NAD(P)-dependent oxidoreductase [Solirubrobacterales bacterium]
MSDRETVALLGAGSTMGFPMARNIARAGIPVRAWNRTAEKARPLTEDGVEVLDDPREAATGAIMIVTMLRDADAVIGAMDGEYGAFSAPQAPAMWVQMSTVGERGTERCAQLADERGISFVDAPVLGTKQPAQEGKLVVLASGPEELRERLTPIFDAVGQRTMWLGEAGAGTRLKLAVNLWVLQVTEGVAEAVAFTEGLGLDAGLLFEALTGGPLDMPYFQFKGKAIRERNFEPMFSLALAAKDAALMAEAATNRGLDLPLLETIRDRLAQGAREHGEKDMSATYLTSAPG